MNDELPGRSTQGAASPGEATAVSGEAAFWDRRADDDEYRGRLEISPDQYMAREVWLQAWEPLLPDVSGKTVLDCGSGLGAIAAWFAGRGANVVGFDLSQGMAHLAREYAAHHGSHVAMISSTFEELPLADASVDLAVGQYILHHTDLDRSMAELKRVVKPGGMGLFVENMALNPLIRRYVRSNLFEEGVMREGSPEECPILPEKVEMMRRLCTRVEMHWPSYVFFEILFSRVPLLPRRGGQWLDDAIFRLIKDRPSLLKGSYFAVLELHF